MENIETRFVADVISGGRITIPDTVRKLRHIKEGDELELAILEVRPKKGE